MPTKRPTRLRCPRVEEADLAVPELRAHRPVDRADRALRELPLQPRVDGAVPPVLADPGLLAQRPADKADLAAVA